jgi:hypothetical protein
VKRTDGKEETALTVNPRLIWKSKWRYDPFAQRIKVDGFKGRYDAFVQYVSKLTKEDRKAEASGNVIHMRIESKRYLDCVLSGSHFIVAPIDEQAERHNMTKLQSLFEHEGQHVVQHYEVRGFDIGSSANPLPWENEACARQILHSSFQNAIPETKDWLRFSILDNLMKYGMESTDAETWISDVERRGTYPGVNLPRQITLKRAAY